MRKVCYAIIGKTRIYMSESCICEDADQLEDELKIAKKEEPEEDYKICPIYTLRKEKQKK